VRNIFGGQEFSLQGDAFTGYEACSLCSRLADSLKELSFWHQTRFYSIDF
jgi:hypothetical protein